MNANPFTRPTVVAAIEFLGSRSSQATFDLLLMRMSMEDEVPLGTGNSVNAKTALLARAVLRRQSEILNTLDGPVTLAEAAIREAVAISNPNDTGTGQQRFMRGLSLDGYSVAWEDDAATPRLRSALPSDVDLTESDDELHLLLKRFGFSVSLGHLDQAIDAHARGDWAAANSQLRSFLEGLLDEIASNIDPQQAAVLRSSENRRAWLAEQGFLSSSRNEWTADGKNYINGLFKMLHTDGSHPGLSDEDHSTFRLHLGLITGRTLVRRLSHRS